MPLQPNDKVLLTLGKRCRQLLNQLSAEDAEPGMRPNASMMVRKLIYAEINRRSKARKAAMAAGRE